MPTSLSRAEKAARSERLELWGGHECTVNRVGDDWFDQTERSGHQHRIGDLALFAGLGIRKLRYPALWERMAREGEATSDFGWTDERLPEIRRLGMEPILTLCHHGSGPGHTSLIDESFAVGLARHAAAVAQRYPWVEDYTPVNEPLTTARFSALYGFWYPHTQDENAFWTALLNETDATRLSMRAIRAVNPAARLVQTDDLGFCHATPPLADAARFQNDRRWMGWDLLCGMVVPGHPLWDGLVARGFEDRLQIIADDPCPPDVIGINHYLSSERLLDHRVERHGSRAVADQKLGHTGGVVHVDVDAARAIPEQTIGLEGLIEQAWERYRLPIAITEAHLGSTRDDQARWFVDVWAKAERLRAKGVDLRAVTAWSLLGSYDWNRMVTRCVGHYEPGVFDVRSGTPRPTFMAYVLRELAHGRVPQGPGLHVTGWWHPERRGARHVSFEMRAGPRSVRAPKPLLIVDDNGPIGRLAIAACEARGLHYVVSKRDDARSLRFANPWAVFDTRVGRAEHHTVTSVSQGLGITAAVFATTAHAESNILAIEAAPIFTLDDADCLAHRLLADFESERSVAAACHLECQEIYGPSLVDTVLDLLIDGVTGPVRLVPQEQWSQAEFAETLAHVAGRPPELIVAEGEACSHVADVGVSHLPPTETMLERFVCDYRAASLGKGMSRGRAGESRVT